MLDLQRNLSLDHTAIPDCLDDGLELGKAMEQISPPIGDMHYELARARTFQNCWPADGSGEKLASYGFYCIRDGERVRCAFCGLEISGLYVPAEDVKFRHWQFARNYCRFLKGEDVGNVTADTTSCVRNDNVLSKRRVDSVGGGSNPRIEQSRLLRATPVNLPPLAPLHGNHSSSFVSSSPAIIHPEVTSPPRHTLPSASAARHTPSQQPGPSQHHSHPRPSASPSSEPHHQAASPATTKTTTPLPSNIVIPPPTATPPPPPLPPPSDHAVPTMAWVDIIRTARYPQMAAFQARLDTLSTWPLVKPTPEELARAGLFHVKCRSTRKASRSDLEVWRSGDGGTPASPLLNGGIVSGPASSSRRVCVDSVKCFWCGERFHRWQKTDDALLEHARLSPACRYVTRLVGQQLHNDVVNAASAGVGDRFFTGENQPSSPTPPRATTTTTTTTATTTTTSSKPDLDDIMESDPVQTVLQMGFPRRLIRDLLSQNSHRLTAETLCHLALQAAQGASAAQRPAQDTEGPVPGTDRPVPGTDRPVPGTDRPVPGTERSLPGDREKETAHVRAGRNDGGPSRFLEDDDQRTNLTRPKSAGEELTAPPLVPSAPFLLDLSGRHERVACKVCSEAEVKVTFRPCNHLVCCSQCAMLFTTCPVCEHPIEDTLTTYLS